MKTLELNSLRNARQKINDVVKSFFHIAYYLWLAATIIYGIFWVLDATQPQPPFPQQQNMDWLNFNLNHPIFMYVGLASIIIFGCIYATKIINWLQNL